MVIFLSASGTHPVTQLRMCAQVCAALTLICEGCRRRITNNTKKENIPNALTSIINQGTYTGMLVTIHYGRNKQPLKCHLWGHL